MDNSVTIVVPLHAKPGRGAQVREALRALAAQSSQEPGNVFYTPHETIDNPDKFIIHERWADQAALDFHMAQDHLKAFLADSDAWLDSPIKGEICRELPP